MEKSHHRNETDFAEPMERNRRWTLNSTVSGNGRALRQKESVGSFQGWSLSMGELGGELWGLVGLVVDVIRGSVVRDSN